MQENSAFLIFASGKPPTHKLTKKSVFEYELNNKLAMVLRGDKIRLLDLFIYRRVHTDVYLQARTFRLACTNSG